MNYRNMENKTFIKIPNNFFTIEKNEFSEEIEISKFKQFGTEGFTIWTYLLYTQGNQVSAQTSIKRIQSFLNRNMDSRGKKAKNGLTDARTIKKYLNVLLKMDMIKIEEFIDDDPDEEVKEQPKNNYFENIRADEELFIEVNPMDDGNGFSAISTQLFYDYVHKIGHIGWSIYCLLFKNHNTGFGNTDETYGNCGFASCSEEYIANILGINKSTVSDYITNQIPKKLVKVQSQPTTTYYDFQKNKEITKYMPNHYIVLAKGDSENKYYINNVKKTGKEAEKAS